MFHKQTEQPIETMLLTSRQTAKLLNISERTVFTMTKNGDLPAIKFGRCLRYSLEDLRKLVRQRLEEKSKEDKDNNLHSAQ